MAKVIFGQTKKKYSDILKKYKLDVNQGKLIFLAFHEKYPECIILFCSFHHPGQ